MGDTVEVPLRMPAFAMAEELGEAVRGGASQPRGRSARDR